MLKPAFGAISLLLAILILGLLAAMTLPVLKTTTSGAMGPSSIKQESVEEKADQMIEDIQRMREETNKYYNEN